MGEKQKPNNMRVMLVMLILLLVLAVSTVLAIGIGSVFIPPGKVLEVLLAPINLSDMNSIIVHNMRLCRVIAGMFGGAALALSGLLLQILFNNPIADPYVLGISSGARLFVGFAVLGGVTFGLPSDNSWFMFIGGFVGSMVMMAIILVFAQRIKSVTSLLIVGMMLSYLCSAGSRYYELAVQQRCGCGFYPMGHGLF